MDGPQANPYAAPAADVNAAELVAGATALRLAGPLARLWAALLDGVLYVGTIVVAVFGGVVLEGMAGRHGRERSTAGLVVMLGGILALVVLFVFQVYRVSTTGQTLGKKWLDIRIVKMDGSPVSFGSAFMLRSFVPRLFSSVPYLGAVFSLVDILFIFREDRRCIHDLIASTQVVDVE